MYPDPSPLISGTVYGRLSVVKHSGSILYGHSKQVSRTRKHMYLCLCSCGNSKIILKGSLLSGKTVSCGCKKYETKTNGRKRDPKYNMWYNAKSRARERGLEFSIDLSDIFVPDSCPALGIPLKFNRGCHKDDSPSLDRVDNTKGYTPDNIWVISYKANQIKNIYSYEELKSVVAALELREKSGRERLTVERNKKKELMYDRSN